MKLWWLNVSIKYLATDLSINILLLICIFTNCLTLSLYFRPSYSFLFLTFFFGNRFLFAVNFLLFNIWWYPLFWKELYRAIKFGNNISDKIHVLTTLKTLILAVYVFSKVFNLKRRQKTKFLQDIFILLLSSGSHFIHSLVSEYCWIARDSEPVISLTLSLRI